MSPHHLRFAFLVGIFGAATGTAFGQAVTINPDIKRNRDEYAAAQMALPTLLKSCGEIDMMTPSSADPGGWIVDCANGDRYRVRSGDTKARFEKSYGR